MCIYVDKKAFAAGEKTYK